MVATINKIFFSNRVLFVSNLQFNGMIFSVSKEKSQRFLDFGQDSVILTVNDLVREMTMRSHEIPLPAWNLLLSQRQKFLNNLLAQIPILPKQQGTHEMKEEVLSIAESQYMDTSDYEVSDLNDIEFFSRISQLALDVFFRP